MQFKEIVEQLYHEDGIRNKTYLETILDKDFELEWDSSVGLKYMSKSQVLDMADELKSNYHISKTSILNCVSEGNKLVVHYLHHVSTIENPKELFTIAKVVVIWEIENNKIIKGYQISKAG